MSKYKSYKLVSFKQPIVVSFTIGSSPQSNHASYIFGLANEDQSNIRSIKIDTNHDFSDKKRYEKQLLLTTSSSKLYVSNYGQKLFGTNVEIIKKPQEASVCATIEKDSQGNIIIPKKDQDGNFILSDNTYLPIKDGNTVTYHFNSLQKLNDGSHLFVETNDIQGIDEIYYKGIEYYVQDKKYIVEPSILCNDQIGLLIDANEQDSIFLIYDYQLSRDLEDNPISRFISSQKQEVTDSFYSDNKQFAKDQHRVRFVVSDQGRIISCAVWNSEKEQFDLIKSFIFPKKIQGNCYITLNLKQQQYTNDITSNF